MRISPNLPATIFSMSYQRWDTHQPLKTNHAAHSYRIYYPNIKSHPPCNGCPLFPPHQVYTRQVHSPTRIRIIFLRLADREPLTKHPHSISSNNIVSVLVAADSSEWCLFTGSRIQVEALSKLLTLSLLGPLSRRASQEVTNYDDG
ncbi:hypothetical protein AVEN_251208-1 [Araneus ventricosus]|uniref:Uncharacterized protein n=1 Tax=Araneus ventricosus TaxID=182803 RepID=A0A4Y2QZY8_ARAVE|nr:hypothetical protein AVEN_251208-1 [Araneus ventricosus]